MIGRLTGKILFKKAPELLLDVSGVGYEVLLPLSVFYKLPDVGADISLHTHLVVREDEHILYGFSEEGERAIFRQLIKVSGIGPKTALAILSSTTPELLVDSVVEENLVALSRLPGIGKKSAQRMVIELRDKWLNTEFVGDGAKAVAAKGEGKQNQVQDAVSALIALGYSPKRSKEIVFKVKQDGLASDELIKLALKEI